MGTLLDFLSDFVNWLHCFRKVRLVFANDNFLHTSSLMSTKSSILKCAHAHPFFDHRYVLSITTQTDGTVGKKRGEKPDFNSVNKLFFFPLFIFIQMKIIIVKSMNHIDALLHSTYLLSTTFGQWDFHRMGKRSKAHRLCWRSVQAWLLFTGDVTSNLWVKSRKEVRSGTKSFAQLISFNSLNSSSSIDI
jgi:hypothetical protein